MKNRIVLFTIILLVLASVGFGLIANLQYLYLGRVVFRQTHAFLLMIPALVVAILIHLRSVDKGILRVAVVIIALALSLIAISSIKVIFLGYDSSELSETLFQSVFPMIAYAGIMIGARYAGKWTVGLRIIAIFLGLVLILLGLYQWLFRTTLLWTGDPDLGWQSYIWVYGEDAKGYIIRAFSTFQTPVVFGLFAISVSLYFIVKFRLKSLPVLTLGLLAVYASLNRTVWVVFIFSVISLIAINSKRISKVLALLIPLIPLASLGLMLALGTYKDVLLANKFTYNLGIRANDNPRLVAESTDSIVSILLGSNLKSIRMTSNRRLDGIEQNPIDNEVLYLYIRYGFFGILLLSLTLFIITNYYVGRYRRYGEKADLAAASLVIGMAVGSVTNVVFTTNLYLVAILYVLLLLKKGGAYEAKNWPYSTQLELK